MQAGHFSHKSNQKNELLSLGKLGRASQKC